MLNIALPKGRMGNHVYKLFESLDCGCVDFNSNRKLIFENEDGDIRYFLVKPSDVAIYVTKGAADIGVVGRDILLETKPDIYELLDLGLGRCRIVVAGPNGYVDDRESVLRVATKYVNISREYYSSQNRRIEIIKLNGSIELAPILNLSDVVVDIVETGSTLRENNMRVLEEITDSSARLIANKASYKFKAPVIDSITARLREVLQNDQNR